MDMLVKEDEQREVHRTQGIILWLDKALSTMTPKN